MTLFSLFYTPIRAEPFQWPLYSYSLLFLFLYILIGSLKIALLIIIALIYLRLSSMRLSIQYTTVGSNRILEFLFSYELNLIRYNQHPGCLFYTTYTICLLILKLRSIKVIRFKCRNGFINTFEFKRCFLFY